MIIKIIKIILKTLEHIIKSIIAFLFKKKILEYLIKKSNYKNIPIYIISYNRLNYLIQTISWLEKYGYTNITIIDNKSTYIPLLEYYKKCNYKIVFMQKNWGHNVFYLAPKFFFKRNFTFFCLSDPDLTPIPECKDDFIMQFLLIMYTYPEYAKIGFSLKIDDLPDNYYLKEEVITWESRFYTNLIKNTKFNFPIYIAEIDTTFALHTPSIMCSRYNRGKGIRTGLPYQVRHNPWYATSLSNEETNYIKTIRSDVSNWNGNFSKEVIRNRINEWERNSLQRRTFN